MAYANASFFDSFGLLKHFPFLILFSLKIFSGQCAVRPAAARAVARPRLPPRHGGSADGGAGRAEGGRHRARRDRRRAAGTAALGAAAADAAVRAGGGAPVEDRRESAIEHGRRPGARPTDRGRRLLRRGRPPRRIAGSAGAGECRDAEAR